ncbi:MAG: hypothetical protein HY037_07445, partial [Nitrospirae bacterium]|nr:hypothetical protein [Candidatus Troglogloeales bacterium]
TLSNTPIDYLDFASPESGLGSKMGIDATTKIGTETTRAWGKRIMMDQDVVKKVDTFWNEMGLSAGTGFKPALVDTIFQAPRDLKKTQ